MVFLYFYDLTPKIFPKEISGVLLKAAFNPMPNSGSEVAAAIKIKESVNSDIFKK